MTETQAVWGYGTLLQMNTGGGMTTIAEVFDIPVPQMQRDQVDVTNHSSPNGYEEFIMTLKRSGEITFKTNFFRDPTQDEVTGYISLFNNGIRTPFQVVLAGSLGTWTFNAYVKAVKGMAPVNAQITAEVTLKPSGPMVLA
jgi:hypothetical protein